MKSFWLKENVKEVIVFKRAKAGLPVSGLFYMKEHRGLRLMEGSGNSFGLALASIKLNPVVWGSL